MWIYEQAILCAALMNDLDLTPDEVRSVEVKVAAERAAMERVVGRHRALLRGVLRIQNGESRDRVLLELSQLGIRPHEVEDRLDHYQTAQRTQEALNRDEAAAIQEGARAGIRRDLLYTKLSKYVQERANASGMTREREEDALWGEAIKHCQIQVVDQRYEFPTFKGVFERHAESVQIP